MPEDGVAMRERGFQVLAYADVWVFERALRQIAGAQTSTTAVA